jgi:hypothetical protein
MVNAPKKYIVPLPAGRYGRSTKRSTQRRQQANEGKSGLEEDRIRAIGALRSLKSTKRLAAEKRREMHLLSNEQKEKWIKDCVERETAGARKRVENAEAAVQQKQDNMTQDEIAGLTSRLPEKMFEEMLVAIRDSRSDLANSENGEHGEDEDDEDTEQGNLNENDEPGWVIGTITKMVLQRMELFQQKQMKLDEFTQPEWGDAADNVREQDKTYSTSEFRVLAVIQLQTNNSAMPPPPTTFAELMGSLDVVPGISQRPQGTSCPGSSHIRLGLVEPQLKLSIPGGEPAAEPNLSMLLKAKLV